MIFAEGRSNKNVGAIASYLADELKNAGVKQVNIEGLEKIRMGINRSRWYFCTFVTSRD
jgi:ribosomal silencing factor RsfS